MLLVPLAFASVAAPRSTHPQQENELARCSISSRDALYFWNVLSFSTGRLRQSKAVGGTQPMALPSSPIRAVFLDSNRWVVEPAVMRLKSSPRPHSSVPRGDGQYDEERLCPGNGSSKKKMAPTLSCRGQNRLHPFEGGRAATTLSNAAESESAARQDCV